MEQNQEKLEPKKEVLKPVEPAPVVEGVGRITQFLSSVGILEKRSKFLLVILLLIVFMSAWISFSLMPPFSFPKDKMITVRSGALLS